MERRPGRGRREGACVRWPFVSRSTYNHQRQAFLDTLGLAQAIKDGALRERDEAKSHAAMADHNLAEMRKQYHDLLDRYDSLARLMVNAPVAPAYFTTTPAVVEPMGDMPPQVVLDAMRTISPVRDKTYDANWAFWEANKERAKEHPDAFAEEILDGFTEPALD
jgi:hypothetical protein